MQSKLSQLRAEEETQRRVQWRVIKAKIFFEVTLRQIETQYFLDVSWPILGKLGPSPIWRQVGPWQIRNPETALFCFGSFQRFWWLLRDHFGWLINLAPGV